MLVISDISRYIYARLASPIAIKAAILEWSVLSEVKKQYILSELSESWSIVSRIRASKAWQCLSISSPSQYVIYWR